MRALVTGGAGFIGSHLVERLLASGHEVVVLDDLSTGRAANLPEHPALRLLRGRVQDPEASAAAARGARVVFHLAGCPSVPASLADPHAAVQSTVLGTEVVLEAARRAGVRRLVLASSSAVYGAGAPLPLAEHHPTDPLTPYAATRLAAEQLARAWHRAYGLPAVALRFFNVYGPRQVNEQALVPALIGAALRGEAARLHGGGAPTRDLVYVDDAVEAALRAAATPTLPPEGCVNVARGQELTVRAVHDALAALTGGGPPPLLGPPRPGDLPRSAGDPRMARVCLGFTARVGLAEGLARTLRWFEARPALWRRAI